MPYRRRFLALTLIAPGAAAWADLYDDYINSVSKKPFVAFLGRKATTSTIGHAFVGAGVELEAGLLLYERFFGLYPKDGNLAAVKSVFTKQSGKLDRTWDDLTWDTELRRFIDADHRSAVLALFTKWSAAAPSYSLTANNGMNCNSLVGDVAKSVKLNVPSGAGDTRPWKYIEALKTLNP